MSYSRDFTDIRIRDNGTSIILDALSIDDDTGLPGIDDPATEIYAAVSKISGGPAFVSNVLTTVGAEWSLEIPDAADDLPDGAAVFVIGIAREGDGPPQVWLQHKSIGMHGGDPPVEGGEIGEVVVEPGQE